MLVDDYAIKVSIKDFWTGSQSMEKRVAWWKQSHGGQNPKIVFLKPNGADWVSFNKYLDMYVREEAWLKQYGKRPNFCWVTKGGKTPASNKSQFHLSVENALGRTYTNITEFIAGEKAHGENWADYANDIYTQAQEINRLKNAQPLNCSDNTQLLFSVAKDLGIYNTVNYIHLRCPKSGAGHIILEIQGGEFPTRKWIDISAMLHSGYAMGTGWCYDKVDDKTFVSRNDPWLMSDDGKT